MAHLKTENIIFEIAGWIGTVMILLAYGLLSFSVIKPGILFQILSGGGAIGIIMVSFRKKNYQPGVVNAVWLIIAIVAIIRLLIY